MAKNSVAPVVLTPPVTAFDFLEGGFARSRRSRMMGLVAVGVSVVALALSGAAGMMGVVDAGANQQTLTNVQSDLVTAQVELAQLDSHQGFSTAELNPHIAARQRVYDLAVAGEVDAARVMGDLWASAPVGVTISKVTFAGAESGPGTAEVEATVSSFPLIQTWVSAVQALTVVESADAMWSGGGDAVQVTVDVVLGPEALTPRSQEVGDVARPEVPTLDAGDDEGSGEDE